MNAENTKYLLEKYPGLYQQYHLPENQTCMCWGFDCDDGWFHIIDKLSEEITKIAPNVQASQVKEKFGALRFYIDGIDTDTTILDDVYSLINNAEDASYRTCETCGSTENVTQTKGWITSLCELCKISKKQSEG